MPADDAGKPLSSLGDDYASRYGFHDPEDFVQRTPRGISHEVVETISRAKREPDWMREFRHNSLETFLAKPMPDWGNQELLGSIRFDDIYCYVKPTDRQERTWEEVPENIRNTFERLGVPEAERKFLAGVSAQYESEVVYHSFEAELAKQGVVFLDMDSGLREHEGLVREHFSRLVPPSDNKFAALNSAVWSGGTFIYVPPGISVGIPLQAYFRINMRNMGQFERTLIIVGKGSRLHYIEGCTAPVYTTDSLHAAVVEIFAEEDSRVRYTTIQNWSTNVFNLVTKRALARAGALVEWVDGNIGSKLTMKYPAIVLAGKGARAEVLSVALAGKGQHQDTGAKALHAAPGTSSRITSKSISKDGGRASYRGLVRVAPAASDARVSVQCDALLLGGAARSDTYPTMEMEGKAAKVEHEARVSRISADQVFYLQSRGLSADAARLLIVNGFMEPFTKELPLEYAVEFNRLIGLEMEGTIG